MPQPIIEPKPWWKSRTIWLNVGVILLGLIEAGADVVPPEYQPLALAVAGLLNAIVRLDTKRPVRA